MNNEVFSMVDKFCRQILLSPQVKEVIRKSVLYRPDKNNTETLSGLYFKPVRVRVKIPIGLNLDDFKDYLSDSFSAIPFPINWNRPYMVRTGEEKEILPMILMCWIRGEIKKVDDVPGVHLIILSMHDCFGREVPWKEGLK